MSEDQQFWQQYTASVMPLKDAGRIAPTETASTTNTHAAHFGGSRLAHKAFDQHDNTSDPSLRSLIEQVLARAPSETAEVRHTGFILRYNSQRVTRAEVTRLRKIKHHDAWLMRMPELDLHGMTVAQSRRMVCDALLTLQQQGARHLHLIHGKGTARLKSHVYFWLPQLPFVVAAYSVLDSAGQSGALIVQCKWQ